MSEGGVSKDAIKAVVAKLDGLVTAGTLGWKTARNIWTIVSKGFKNAVSAKDATLCVLQTNPCAGIAAPDKGQSKAKQHLHPDEFLQLVSCTLQVLMDYVREAENVREGFGEVFPPSSPPRSLRRSWGSNPE
jgi:hypothetical protein